MLENIKILIEKSKKIKIYFNQTLNHGECKLMLHIPQNVVKTALDRSHIPTLLNYQKKQCPLPFLTKPVKLKRIFSFRRKREPSDVTESNTLIFKQ